MTLAPTREQASVYAQAVTGASGIPVGYALLALVYLAVALGVVWVLRRLARAPLERADPVPPGTMQQA